MTTKISSMNPLWSNSFVIRVQQFYFFAAVNAPGFIGRDMTIQNTAGPAGEQAVALRAGGDQLAFSNVNLEGYQVLILLNLVQKHV